MSAPEFWITLAVIVAAAAVLTIAGVAWAMGRPSTDEPIEHGDGEP